MNLFNATPKEIQLMCYFKHEMIDFSTILKYR